MPKAKTETSTEGKKLIRRGRPPKNPEAARTAKSEPPKKAFVFFNCDGDKTQASKNIFYNNEIYRDVNSARKDLWDRIKDEVEKGTINVIDDEFTKVRHEILYGSPVEAGKYLQFASIDEMIIH